MVGGVGGKGEGGQGEGCQGGVRGHLGGVRGCWYQAKCKGIGNCKKCRSK